MSTSSFKAKAYVKDGCPFSFKFLVFMSESGLLDSIEIVRLDGNAPDFAAAKDRLSDALGQAATFPTVEIAPGRFMTDSDRIIEHFAQDAGLNPNEMPVLAFYKQTIFPKLGELHRLKAAGQTG